MMDILGEMRGNGLVKELVGGMTMGNEVGLKVGARIGMEDEQRVDAHEVEETGVKPKGDLVKERSEIANLLYLRCKSLPSVLETAIGKLFYPVARV